MLIVLLLFFTSYLLSDHILPRSCIQPPLSLESCDSDGDYAPVTPVALVDSDSHVPLLLSRVLPFCAGLTTSTKQAVVASHDGCRNWTMPCPEDQPCVWVVRTESYLAAYGGAQGVPWVMLWMCHVKGMTNPKSLTEQIVTLNLPLHFRIPLWNIKVFLLPDFLLPVYWVYLFFGAFPWMKFGRGKPRKPCKTGRLKGWNWQALRPFHYLA